MAKWQGDVERGYILQQESTQLLTAVVQTLSVRGIDYPDQCVCLLKVVLPVCPECLLAADVPWPRISRRVGHGKEEGKQMFSLYLSTLSSAHAQETLVRVTNPS